jgi:hypothetical protein
MGRSGDERLPLAERVVLAQGVPLELLVHEDASEIGMAGEADAVEVPHEPLPPVRALEDRGGARQLGVRLAHPELESQMLLVGDRVEEIDDLERGSFSGSCSRSTASMERKSLKSS